MKIFLADIGGTSVKTAIANEKAEFSSFGEFDSESEKGGQQIIQRLINKIEQYNNLDAIGISTAGQVDSETGTIIFANDNIPDYTGTKIKEILENRFNIPVAVENDVNAMALGEFYYGAGKAFSDFICLTYGTGIGGAIFSEGELFKGSDGFAGEFGHIVTHGNGEVCTCGFRGCYERYASTTALVKKAKQVDSELENGRLIFEALKTGPHGVQHVVDEWIDEVVVGLVSIVNIFNPAYIILGGGIMEQPSLTPLINKKVKKAVMPSLANVKIISADLGNKSGLYGALALILKSGKEETGVPDA